MDQFSYYLFIHLLRITIEIILSMSKFASNFLRFLYGFSGEDRYIIEKIGVSGKFAFIGLLVLLISLGCFVSALFFIIDLFDGDYFLGIPIGVLWGLVICNLYILLLYTISPPTIPSSVNKNSISLYKQSFFNLSMIFRLFFMMFMAIIVAQPLNVVIFGKNVDDSINEIKLIEKIRFYYDSNKMTTTLEWDKWNEVKNRYVDKLDSKSLLKINFIERKIIEDSLFSIRIRNDLKFTESRTASLESENIRKTHKHIHLMDGILKKQLVSDYIFLQRMKALPNQLGILDISLLKDDFVKLYESKIQSYNSLKSSLGKSNFYLKRIKLIGNEGYGKGVSVAILIIFILPIFIKYDVSKFIRNKTKANFYYQEKNVFLIKQLMNISNFKMFKEELLELEEKDFIMRDYFYTKMLIEHRIILEEYENMKIKYNAIFSEKIRMKNKSIFIRLLPFLNEIKKNDKIRYSLILKEILEGDLNPNERIEKDEYYEDAPFRSVKKQNNLIVGKSKDFLEFVMYNK